MEKQFPETKILSKEEVKKRIHICKLQGKKVVFTNGCFDILHRGHVDYLCKAKALGHFLIIGLNTDSSVRRLGKSPERPINPEDSRAFILAALHCVDAVVLFDEDTPYQLIADLMPDVLVKGDDYLPEQIAGHDIVKQNGGLVCTVPLVKGYSTTSLIEKLKHQG